MMINERVSYQKIKSLVLMAYFDFCRDRAIGMGWPHDQILGSVAYEYENVFTSQIEKLMFCVVQLVMSGGWYKDVESSARKWIAELLAEISIEKLLEGIQPDEAKEFSRDLEILKLT